MSKILIIGDIHLRAKRLKDVATAWRAAVLWANRNEVDVILQAGDIFDHVNVYGREASTGTIFDAFIGPFFENPKPVPLVLIPGNHDIGPPRDKDALSPIDKYDWIKVIRQPSVHHILGNLSVCAIPWINRVHLVAKLIGEGMKPGEATHEVESEIANMARLLRDVVKADQDAGRFVILLGHLEVFNATLRDDVRQVGGSFEFTPQSLLDIGADAIALGHLHVRQHIPGFPNPNDGYLGCLAQLNFGEEKNDVGCRFIEIDGRKIVSDRWMNNKNSPRYFTVSDMQGLLDKGWRPGVDYIKFRGHVKPDNLLPGMIFERLPDVAMTTPRTQEKLDCDSGLRTLLAAWQRQEKCPVDLDRLVAEAESLMSTVSVQEDAIGSLERINCIKVEYLTCHGRTVIELADFKGICGLSGPSGTGKTTAIEAIMFVLYGVSPSRPIPDLIPDDVLEAAAELEFVSSGKTYVARREIKRDGKKFPHKALVFEKKENIAPATISDLEKKVKALAGTKVEDVFSYTSRLVGDYDMVFSGIFSSQGDEGNLVNMKAAGRKDLFAKLLGTDKFFPLSEAAKKLVQSDEAIIQANSSRLETLKLELAAEPKDKAEAERLANEMEKGKKQMDEAQACFDAAAVWMRETEQAGKDRAKALARMAELEAKKQALLEEGRDLKRKKQEIETLDMSSIVAELETARKCKEELDILDAQFAAANEESHRLVQEASALRNEAEKTLSKRSMEYVAHVEETNKNIYAVGEERNKGRAELEVEVNKIRIKLTSLIDQIEEAKRRVALLRGFPDLEACQICPLAKDIIATRADIPKIESRIENGKQKLEQAKADLDNFNKETVTVMMEAKSSLIANDDWQPEVLQNAKETNEKAAELEKKSKSTVTNEMVDKRVAVHGPALRVHTLEERISRIKTDAAKIDGLLDAARKNYADACTEVKNFVVPPESKDGEAAKKEYEAAALFRTDLSKRMSNIGVELGKNQAAVEQHAARRKEAEKLGADVKARGDKIEVRVALAKAFSRDGIAQLIVDTTIPQLHKIMFDLLSECEGKWTIRMATQRETQKGNLKEQIDILVHDNKRERDISTYSGGEKNLLAVVVRIAFSILQAERSGKGLKVLVLDEAMFFTDTEQAEAFMRMLKQLPKYFNQIFVVSHSDFILSSIPDKIFFSLDQDGHTSIYTSFAKGA